MKKIERLEAENPQVKCPACRGKKRIIMGRNLSDTGWCYDNCSKCNGEGTIPTVQAQKYRIKELEAQLAEAN